MSVYIHFIIIFEEETFSLVLLFVFYICPLDLNALCLGVITVKIWKILISKKSKIWLFRFYQTAVCPNDAYRMANSIDPDQTAPLGAKQSSLTWICTFLCFFSTLFTQTCLSENFGSSQTVKIQCRVHVADRQTTLSCGLSNQVLTVCIRNEETSDGKNKLLKSTCYK